jgi:hypothetical protein
MYPNIYAITKNENGIPKLISKKPIPLFTIQKHSITAITLRKTKNCFPNHNR